MVRRQISYFYMLPTGTTLNSCNYNYAKNVLCGIITIALFTRMWYNFDKLIYMKSTNTRLIHNQFYPYAYAVRTRKSIIRQVVRGKQLKQIVFNRYNKENLCWKFCYPKINKSAGDFFLNKKLSGTLIWYLRVSIFSNKEVQIGCIKVINKCFKDPHKGSFVFIFCGKIKNVKI